MRQLNRRQVLGYSAASALAAPFVRMLERPARAAVDTGGAKRLLVFFSPNGVIHDHWRPIGSETSFNFAAGSVLEALTPHKDDLIIIDGMDFAEGDNHEGGMAAMLTANGPNSLDQVVADHIGTSSRFGSLEFGVQTSAWGGNVQTRMCYRDGSYVTPDDDPQNVFNRLFGDLGDDTLGLRRQSVIDLAKLELTDLRTRLGVSERLRLDAHIASIEAVERSLSGGSTCDSPTSPSYLSASDNDNFPDITTQQIDLAVQALACGSTNVATLQLSHTVSPTVFTWLGETDGHHSLSHVDDGNTAGVASFVNCERWFAEQFAHLLDQLVATEDPDTGGSMLDSTLVLWAKELGDGRAHTCTDVPWIIAGNAGGFFSTGRYLNVGGATQDGVLTSICNAFGMENETFGAGSHGPLGALR
jgi:hypothetical protein